MRWIKALILGLTGMLVSGAAAQAADPPIGGAWVSAVEGVAQVEFAEDPDWQAASASMPLLPGDRLQLGPNGRIEIFLSNTTAIRLGPDSAAELMAVPQADSDRDGTAEMDLVAGRAIVVPGDGERTRPVVTLNAPGTRIQVYPRSHLYAQVVAADATDVMLREGAVTVEALGSVIPLRTGETLRVGRGATFLVANHPSDDFDRWSESRANAFAAVPAGSSYVPAPLVPYATDLSRYGQWTTVPEYGYVWQPTGVVDGWAPFTDGHWAWRGGTWVWIPREVWGWVPFHYGRWRWDPFLSWYWVPPRPRRIAWSPGAVAWIQTPGHVAWLPLAPGEIFYGPWPHGIRRAVAPPATLVNVTSVTIQRAFVNAVAPAAVVAVPIKDFGASTRVVPRVTRIPLASLTANQRLSVITPLAPALSMPARGTDGRVAVGSPAAPGSRRPGATMPLPSPSQTSSDQTGGSSRSAQPPLTPVARPTPSAAGLVGGYMAPQPPVPSQRRKGNQQPPGPVAPPSAGVVAPTPPSPSAVADRTRVREAPPTYDPRAGGSASRPVGAGGRSGRRPDVLSLTRPPATGAGQQVSVQSQPDRRAVPPAARPVGESQRRDAARAGSTEGSAQLGKSRQRPPQ